MDITLLLIVSCKFDIIIIKAIDEVKLHSNGCSRNAKRH